MSTSPCPHSLFGKQLHRLQPFGWRVRFYGDDFARRRVANGFGKAPARLAD